MTSLNSSRDLHIKRCLVTIKAVAILMAAASLSSCAGYVPGAKGHWDVKVKEMCEKDGGVTIYERVAISKTDIDRHLLPMTASGKLGVAVKELAHPSAPVYGIERITRLRPEGNPLVSRRELLVIRRTDGATVAKSVSYGRFGGDVPTGLAHDSSFTCPDPEAIADQLAQLFRVEGQ